MAIRDLRFLGDPILRRRSRTVQELDATYGELVNDMIETMHRHRGIGLAAPQIGVSERVIVLDRDPEGVYGRGGFAVINPVILHREGEDEMEEGCLSIPEARDVVRRALKVVVSGIDLDGKEVRFEAEGLLAKVFQHEIDHINGLLFIDHLGPLQRELHINRWRRIRKELEKTEET